MVERLRTCLCRAALGRPRHAPEKNTAKVMVQRGLHSRAVFPAGWAKHVGADDEYDFYIDRAGRDGVERPGRLLVVETS
jgi:hypothetical protein